MKIKLTDIDGSVGSPPFTLGVAIIDPPEEDEVFVRYTFAEEVDFADDFAGSVADVETNPSATYTITVLKDGSSIGTISISTGGAVTFTTTGGAVTFAVGERLSLVGQSGAEGTLAGVSITFLGTRA